jgi:hypothetical protein
MLEGVTCLRLDASMMACHSDKAGTGSYEEEGKVPGEPPLLC